MGEQKHENEQEVMMPGYSRYRLLCCGQQQMRVYIFEDCRMTHLAAYQ